MSILNARKKAVLLVVTDGGEKQLSDCVESFTTRAQRGPANSRRAALGNVPPIRAYKDLRVLSYFDGMIRK
eukprot:2898322-Prorocentrum_lima.AAC.1